MSWPSHLQAAAVRFARPTANYDAALEFYRDVIGLPILAQWRDHQGYDGVVFGLPDTAVHLELLHQAGQPIPQPHPENQLVLYVRDSFDAAVARIRGLGHHPVTPENPYWPDRGAVAFADPDGWLIILAPWVFGEEPS